MQKEIMTIQDLSTYTGWSKSYIYKKTSDGTLKFSKPLGKTIFFSKEWVNGFLMSNPSLTIEEIASKVKASSNLSKGVSK